MNVSVVIPTLGRAALLRRLLDTLDEQDVIDSVEVVVVVDNERGAAIAGLDGRRPGRWPVRVVELIDKPRHHGAGAARNAGVAVARGDVVVFLDDDVVPADPSLLAIHVRAQAEADDVVALGPCVPFPASGQTGPFARAQYGWWLRQSQRLGSISSPVATDLMAGNLSVRRSFLDAIGGFSTIRRREDWELGRRAIRSGGRLVALPAAVVHHDLEVDIGGALRDRIAEGWGDAVIAQEADTLVGPRSWSIVERGVAVAVPMLAALDRFDLDRPFRVAYRVVGHASYRAGWRAGTKEVGCGLRS